MFETVSVGHNKFQVDRRYSGLRPLGDGSYGCVASALDQVTLAPPPSPPPPPLSAATLPGPVLI